MAKFADDLVMDAALDYVIANTERIVVTSSQPANYAAVSAATLAAVAIGTITKANGDTSGRKAVVPQHTAISISASGTATHVCLVKDSATSRLLVVTTCTSQSLTSGGTVTVPTWDEEIADPT